MEYISLVNLIMDKEVVKELIQSELNSENLAHELKKILEGPQREAILKNYDTLTQILGGDGASKKAATLIVENL